VACIVLLRARCSCESRVPDPSDVSQGDPAKSMVDKAGDPTSGLVLPIEASEALRVDLSLLSAVRHELFDAARELPGVLWFSLMSYSKRRQDDRTLYT